MPDPKISVVLPVHFVNEQWLKRSISSVLSQVYDNFELIVVNDSATADIDRLVAGFGIKKYIKNPHRMKLACSFNRGFGAADGEFFSWVAGDDYMLPGMLKKLSTELRARTDVAIISGRTRIIDASDNPVEGKITGVSLAEYYGYRFEDDILDKRYVYFSTISSCWLLRRQVWEKIGGFDESLYGEEDYDFWIRAAREFKIYRLTNKIPPLYAYRVHASSISRTVPYCYTKARIDILKREGALFPGDRAIRTAIGHYKRKQFEEWKRRTVGAGFGRIKRKVADLCRRAYK